MSDLEKAARMALEALEYYQIAGLATTRVVDSITALRQALSDSVKQPASKPNDCARSHPHENMDALCELRTEIARLTNENARFKAQRKPWVGLTDDELEIINDCGDTDSYKFARAIEAKLREKNTGETK